MADPMISCLNASRAAYIEGRFSTSFDMAIKATDLWDCSPELQRDDQARLVRGEALLMAYKASVASTKSRLTEALWAVFIQREIKKDLESSFDAGSELLDRFYMIHQWLPLTRKMRNRKFDTFYGMEPRLRPLATREQMKRFGKRQIGRIKRLLTR